MTDNRPDLYMDVPAAPVICRTCGALVDRAFTTEHSRTHDQGDAA